jgi:hypothetical protein
VAQHVRPADLPLGQDRQHIAGEEGQRVGLDGVGLAGAPVAAQVGDDDLETGFGERGYLMPPEPAGVGKAVQQYNRASRPVT